MKTEIFKNIDGVIRTPSKNIKIGDRFVTNDGVVAIIERATKKSGFFIANSGRGDFRISIAAASDRKATTMPKGHKTASFDSEAAAIKDKGYWDVVWQKMDECRN